MTKDKWKTIGTVFESICVRAVKVMVVAIMGFLCFWTARSTFRFPADYNREWILEYADSPVKNLLAALAVLLMFYFVFKLILRGDEEQKSKRVLRLAVIDVVLVGIILNFWVTVSPIPPYWDQQQVFDAALEFLRGDFGAMDTLYFKVNAHQYSLIFLESALLKIWESYRIIQYVNVILICLIIFMLYRIADCIFHDQMVNLYCLMGITIFLPLHVYVTYVYGDICSIALSLVTVWGALRWNESSQDRYLVISLISAIVATLAREITMIPLIAIFITYLVVLVGRMKWKALLWGLLLLLPLFSVEAVKRGYEIRSGKEIGDVAPMEVWIAMGMQGDWGGKGIYNGYVESVFGGTGADTELTRERTLEDIRGRMEQFHQDPELMKEFYRYKILEQWSEPSYSSLTLTGKKAAEADSAWTDLFYFSLVADYICRFMNYYQFIIYFFTLCYVLGALRQREGIQNVILLIAVIGGFLFSILWEAKGRYVLPYVIFLIPYMARGMQMVQKFVGEVLNRRLLRHIQIHKDKVTDAATHDEQVEHFVRAEVLMFRVEQGEL
ncbi:MAG: hypothetical protein J1E64_12175 [Acetatifactor sp.]|nr:hypothetical protein [Acetatifactor sp.]